MKAKTGKWASYIEVVPWDESFKPLTTKQLDNGIYLDYSCDGRLVGIEILERLEVSEYEEAEE